MKLRWIAVVVACASWPSSCLLARDPATRVRPEETLRDLVTADGAPVATSGESGSAIGAVSRLLGAVVLLAFVGLAAVWVWRRSPTGARARRGQGLVDVLARVVLSSKHSVCVLRVARSRVIVVGVSGDEMRTLAAIDDPSEVAALLAELAPAATREPRASETSVVSTSESASVEAELPSRSRGVARRTRPWRERLAAIAPSASSEDASSQGVGGLER